MLLEWHTVTTRWAQTFSSQCITIETILNNNKVQWTANWGLQTLSGIPKGAPFSSICNDYSVFLCKKKKKSTCYFRQCKAISMTAFCYRMTTAFMCQLSDSQSIIPVLLGKDRNVTYVLDTSEAMAADLGTLKNLIIQCLLTKASLRDSLFNIITFSYKVSCLKKTNTPQMD